MADILDYKLQHDLRRYISRLSDDEQNQLKNLRLCSKRPTTRHQAVYVLASDDGRSALHGLVTCKNPFACPVCAAKAMERYRSRIASAIDCLHEKYFGFMVSLAIPHLAFQGCREVMDILYNTWSYFRMKSDKRDGHGHVYRDFNQEVPVVHHVKVCEQTWGKRNGWHHHFHCIFWVKRGDEQRVLDWEERLNAFWLRAARYNTLKYWKKNKLHNFILEKEGSFDNVIERMFRDKFYHKGFYVSKNPDGTIREVHSATYLTGWTDDREVTGNSRKQATATDRGHMTPYQILEAAAHDDMMRDLYLDFCLAVTRKPVHHRVDFSQTGLKKMVDEWRKVHGSDYEVVRKKKSDGKSTRWRIVAFFDKKQWYELCYLDKHAPVISNILFLAGKYIHLLGDYLSSLDVDIGGSPPREFDEIEAMYNDAS